MGNHKCFGFHLLFIFAFVISASYTCIGYQNTSAVCIEKERRALLNFKKSVRDLSGMLSSWVGNDCCVWEGIHCHSVIGRVESLHLTGCWESEDVDLGCYIASNKVSSSLGELRHLKSLDLSGNDFEGSRIPKFIGSMKQLIYLNLSYAGFEGIIPHHIGNLSNLKVLDLSSTSNYEYKLMVDDMAWTFGLSSLEHLGLSSVDLDGAQNRHMVFYTTPSLKELSLSNCGLSSADLLSFLNSSRILPNIQHLDLSKNSFKGPLPGFFQNMSSLTFLDLSSFNLSLAWNFANFLSTIPSLSELHLSNCGLDKMHLSSPRLNLSTLSNIQHLDLSQNSIEGIFPSFLTNMSSLRVLDLSLNMLNSSVPIMHDLLDLDLSSNSFKQIRDVRIWSQCHLKQLHASMNNFEIEMIDSPKNISECSGYALEWLDLSRCSNGTISEPLGRLSNLRGIFLSSSRLTGPIPESLGRLRSLEVLDLSYNLLTGRIPTFLGNLSTLDLSFNNLNGSIPESFGNLGNLSTLDLSYNWLTGPIPTFLGNISTLILSYNQLNGTIPESIGNLAALKHLDLSSNRLTGPIPTSIGQLNELISLDISNNSLEGVVFELHFANLSMLKYLDVSYSSKLTFNVSSEWTPQFQLISLHLSSCNITNGFPQWLRYQRNLHRLGLSNCTIFGPLPTWWRKMPIIRYLDLSENKLNGPLTNLPNGAHYYHSVYFSALFMQNNFFSESIPTSLCRRIDLEYLDLSKNKLTGKIPKCLGNLQQLSTLILSSNGLCGVIPRCITLNPLSFNIVVREQHLHFEISYTLFILDVGENKLSGNIPDWIGENLTYLAVLRLRKNNFSGRIPQSLCKASNLHILDVAHNNLEGPIPRCLGELKDMVNNSHHVYLFRRTFEKPVVPVVMKGIDLEYTTNWNLVFNMDLSSNKLFGEIPVELTALFMLVSLNLSNNCLSGHIPDTIGEMVALNSLDLSGNELIGAIPRSMADLTFLSHLNLSHNNLSGRIPTGRQLQTLIDPSIYEGNGYLCGPPLPNNCSNPTTPTTSKKKHEAVDEQTKVWLFYTDITCGFATGFWGVIGVLLFKKQWRLNLFMFVEETMDKIYVAVVVRVAKLKRRREAT